VDASISRLFHWGAYADKFGGTVQETTLYGATVKVCCYFSFKKLASFW
jgi:aldehyde dehydrogenase (NAD+)